MKTRVRFGAQVVQALVFTYNIPDCGIIDVTFQEGAPDFIKYNKYLQLLAIYTDSVTDVGFY